MSDDEGYAMISTAVVSGSRQDQLGDDATVRRCVCIVFSYFCLVCTRVLRVLVKGSRSLHSGAPTPTYVRESLMA